ncbi:NUDIX hydrolase YfcD [Thorsellia kenyensis]|uniref:NUDIX hydrolase YfcD n=1 Tax=Thorsellia kenyensis TaxID=1549888 RepID=A0ABV6CB35_9GAMM
MIKSPDEEVIEYDGSPDNHNSGQRELPCELDVNFQMNEEVLTIQAVIDREEWIDLLNPNGVPIGEMTRKVMRENGMLHKATYLIVHNTQNQVLVQKRTLNKDFYPGYWDAAAGGVVQKEEDILLSMKREAEEELGIVDIPFVFHGQFQFSTERQNIIGYLYSCISTGPFALQATEIDEVKWMNIDDIFDNQQQFTTDSIFALTKWINRD